MTNEISNMTSDDIDDLIDEATPEMLQAQQRMQQTVDSGGVTYKWKDGPNKIRLCPAKKGVGFSYFAARQHWGNIPGDDGKPRAKSFLCLAPTGQSCPLCELALQLQQDPMSAEEGKRLEARAVYIYNVIDMTNPDAGPRVAFFSWEAHKPIQELWDAEENPCHWQTGPIFSVKREKRGRVTYTTTPLSARYAIPVESLRNLHDLRKYASIPTIETLNQAVLAITGEAPSQATYTPGLPSNRPQLGSRAAQGNTPVAPPRRNVGSMLRDE